MARQVTQASVVDTAARYGSELSGMHKVMVRYRPYICPFTTMLDTIPEGSSVFDIGCGSGFFLHACRTLRGATETVGVDANCAAVRLAENAARRSFPRETCSFSAGETCGAWPDRTFDVVSIIDVLHHVPRRAQADFIREAGRRVRPGGLLLIKDMLPRPVVCGIMNRLHDLVLARQWISYVDLRGVASLLRAQGFTLEREEDATMLWYAHRLVVMRRTDAQ
ncbi:hypothetical protein dsx2_1061 [Desulfovibrio sp. X2]|uniref:class I SAM-dependent methyltransferase n=1 Tax=Desulfovibrio sp. X2 TaxID=941449 RepID=UPI000358894C|nr:class I SAM-dependent methyltransferase [Desulfovibrio sp. X2]EPR37118.1 hypothetical protein dsx2_1061 [Desulfovibrio sp. X2]